MTTATDNPRQRAESHLRWATGLAGTGIKPAYRVSEVAAILNVHFNTIKKLCDMWEPDSANERDARGLDSYRVGSGQHRRIPYEALIDWFTRNNSYERQYGEQQELFKL